MKKIMILAAAAAFAVGLASCDDPAEIENSNGDNPTPVSVTVSVSPSSVTFEAEGGTLKIAVTTNATSFSISGAPDWVKCEINGKELAITTLPNKVKETRKAVLKVTAGTATCDVEVNQKIGSEYLGYTALTEATMDYSGEALYAFMKPKSEDYGGMASLILTDEDNEYEISFFTPNFASEEEVTLPVGKYTLGSDDMSTLDIIAAPMTFVKGSKQVYDEGTEDEEILYSGSCIYDLTTEEVSLITGGIFEVIEKEGKITAIKFDLTADGKEVKLVYEGEPEITAERAVYPGGNEFRDPTQNVFEAIYALSEGPNDTTQTLSVMLSSVDEADPVVTNFEITVPASMTSDDISGSYYVEFDQEGNAVNNHSVNCITPGFYMELMGFSFPAGTFVADGTNFCIADSMASLILEKQEDGTYDIMAVVMSSDGNMFLFQNIILPMINYEEEYEDYDED